MILTKIKAKLFPTIFEVTLKDGNKEYANTQEELMELVYDENNYSHFKEIKRKKEIKPPKPNENE